MILAAFRAQDLPLIGGGDTYYAAFSESGGLKPNDEVRIAGVRVGKVETVALDGDHVKVTFRVDTDSEFGDETHAAIKVKTLLGAMYLSLEPAGSGQLDEGCGDPGRADQLAVRRRRRVLRASPRRPSGSTPTSSPTSLTTLADLTRNTPEEFREALDGVSALSSNIAARDDQINSLLKNLQRVSSVLDERDEDIVGLMEDSDVLFRALVARREAVHNLLVSTSTLSTELTALDRAEPRRPQAGAHAPRAAWSRCSTRTRTTSTTASG